MNKNTREYQSALRLTEYRSADSEEKRLDAARKMLKSRYPEERNKATNYLLKANRQDELEPLLDEHAYITRIPVQNLKEQPE